MLKKILSINESISKLRNVVLGESYDKNRRQPMNEAEPEAELEDGTEKVNSTGDPSALSMISKHSANKYADQLGFGDKVAAIEIVKNTLMKGASGAVDATYINDLDTRWEGGERKFMSTPRTTSYDYIIQSLIYVMHANTGALVEIGGQEFPVTEKMKDNAYEGLARMFDVTDSNNRWMFFIFGSNYPGVSSVPEQYRPKPPVDHNGKRDYAKIREYLSKIKEKMLGGSLYKWLMFHGAAESGFAYILKCMRNEFLMLVRASKSKKAQVQNPENHTSFEPLSNTIPDEGDGQNREDMGTFIAQGLLAHVEKKFANKPWFIDLFKAKAAGFSLYKILDPAYATLFPHAYEHYKTAKRGAAIQTAFYHPYKTVIRPEAQRLRALFLKNNELDAEPMKARDDWKEKEEKGDNASIYNNLDMDQHDYDKLYASLEEGESEGGEQQFLSALDAFFLND